MCGQRVGMTGCHACCCHGVCVCGLQTGSTPLLVAVQGSHDTIVKALLARRADVNAAMAVGDGGAVRCEFGHGCITDAGCVCCCVACGWLVSV